VSEERRAALLGAATAYVSQTSYAGKVLTLKSVVESEGTRTATDLKILWCSVKRFIA
jgi:hypothetical protein